VTHLNSFSTFGADFGGLQAFYFIDIPIRPTTQMFLCFEHAPGDINSIRMVHWSFLSCFDLTIMLSVIVTVRVFFLHFDLIFY